MRVFVLTHFPSPYQVELFNALAAERNIDLEVFYLHQSHYTRQWMNQAVAHTAHYLNVDRPAIGNAFQCIRSADLCIISYYAERLAAELLGERSTTQRPWIFWGERPGFHAHPVLGRLFRRWKLRALHHSSAPIWGIGRWAVEQYRNEFSEQRHYADVPYFSDLQRFQAVAQPRSDQCVFLFSGALIKRKGVDLLAKAFVDLARSHSTVELIVLGDGEYLPHVRKTLHPCADCVRFLGFKDWNELPQVYQSAHFLCAPSRHDGWGIVVPEALATGLPVISTNRTGAAIEFIQTEKNGWLIPAGDLRALTEAMHEAANLSLAQRDQLSANARASVANHQLADGARKIMTEIEYTLAHWPS